MNFIIRRFTFSIMPTTPRVRSFKLTLPKDGEIIRVGLHDSQPCFWVRSAVDSGPIERYFLAVADDATEVECAGGAEFLGTIARAYLVSDTGTALVHVFEESDTGTALVHVFEEHPS